MLEKKIDAKNVVVQGHFCESLNYAEYVLGFWPFVVISQGLSNQVGKYR
jgi:hypothetical protein